jgi:hypothetical protein
LKLRDCDSRVEYPLLADVHYRQHKNRLMISSSDYFIFFSLFSSGKYNVSKITLELIRKRTTSFI